MANFLPSGIQAYIPSLKGFLFGGPLVAGVEVSVLISESHQLQAEVTKLTMESGTQVSDHVINNPDTVSIVCEVSNVGMWRMSSKDVFEKFRKLIESRELLELITEHYTYRDMVVTGVSPVHSAPFKGRLQITVTLQAIYKVKLQTVGREATKVKTKTAAAEVNAGTQNTQPIKKSLAAKVADKNTTANTVPNTIPRH